MHEEYIIETDILVIGGGMAGFNAAIKAREQGMKVTFVDKGYISKSGQTPFAMDFACFNPEWNHDQDSWLKTIYSAGEYLCNREWTEIILQDSLQRFKDLESWGVEFIRKESGDPVLNAIGGTPTETVQLVERKFVKVLRKHATKLGVNLVDKVMVTDLLENNGKIIGAIGFPTDSCHLYIFKAKATVLTMGGNSIKPISLIGSELTADGDAMAYRAGAEISGKEFTHTYYTGGDPAKWYNFISGISAVGWERSHKNFTSITNSEGNEVQLSSPLGFRELDFEAYAGRTPLRLNVNEKNIHLFQKLGCMDSEGNVPIIGGAKPSMAVHGTEGIWIENKKSAASIPGLYAGGDCASTRHMGAAYAVWGFALCGAAVTGARAGIGAAEYASQEENVTIDNEYLDQIRRMTLAPIKRKGGIKPRWLNQVLNHNLTPYFIFQIKKADRIEASLTIVEYMKENLVPRLYAKDPHELRLAHESKNMVLNAEMKLRASLFRTESRGKHYREDFPLRDDKSWLAWLKLKNDNGEMKFTKEPLPKEWQPNPNKSYEEKYPFRFPGE